MCEGLLAHPVCHTKRVEKVPHQARAAKDRESLRQKGTGKSFKNGCFDGEIELIYVINVKNWYKYMLQNDVAIDFSKITGLG
jgi:hypothetical protein